MRNRNQLAASKPQNMDNGARQPQQRLSDSNATVKQSGLPKQYTARANIAVAEEPPESSALSDEQDSDTLDSLTDTNDFITMFSHYQNTQHQRDSHFFMTPIKYVPSMGRI